jgi:hypothetical protein
MQVAMLSRTVIVKKIRSAALARVFLVGHVGDVVKRVLLVVKKKKKKRPKLFQP